MEQSKALAPVQPAQNGNGALSIYGSASGFEHAQRIAKMLASSNLVPAQYQGNVANTMVALEMANRVGASPLMIMQNLNIIQGKPSFSSAFLIAAINTCGRFSSLRFDTEKLGSKQATAEVWEGPKGARTKKTVQVKIDDQKCTAWTVPAGVIVPAKIRTIAEAEAAGLPVIKGEPVTIEMAVKEGWYTKSDSKWPNMPGLMLSYRAAAFFSRLHCPEITMGMHTADEVIDITPMPVGNETLTVMTDKQPQVVTDPVSKLNEKIANAAKKEDQDKPNEVTEYHSESTTNTNEQPASGDIL